jgi:hypothetical protein
MKLTVLERLLLMQHILPRNGAFIDLLAVESAQAKLKLSDEELKDLEPYTDKASGNIDFDKHKADPVEIDLAPRAITIIETQLIEMEKAKPPKLKLEHVSLYRKFVEKPGEAPDK